MPEPKACCCPLCGATYPDFLPTTRGGWACLACMRMRSGDDIAAEIAGRYWDEILASTAQGILPGDVVALRERYVAKAIANPDTVAALHAWADESHG
jgi:hypothetical protein